jgi:hypothetical protein
MKRPLLKLGQTTIKLNKTTTSETRPDLSGLVSEVVVLLSFIVVWPSFRSGCFIKLYCCLVSLLKLGQTTIKLNEKTTSETRPDNNIA